MFFRKFHAVTFLFLSLSLADAYTDESSKKFADPSRSVPVTQGSLPSKKEAMDRSNVRREVEPANERISFANARIERSLDGTVVRANLANTVFSLSVDMAGKTATGVDVWNLNITSVGLGNMVGQLTPNVFVGVVNGYSMNLSFAWNTDDEVQVTDLNARQVYRFSRNDLVTLAETGDMPLNVGAAKIGLSSESSKILAMTQEELSKELMRNQAQVVGAITVGAAIITGQAKN